MPIRVAAIGVSHWHSLWDSAYLRHLAGMPDTELVGLHDASAEVAAKRAAMLGRPPTFTDYREMLEATRPDFVIALGPHRTMAAVALHLLDRGYPFLMETRPRPISGAIRKRGNTSATRETYMMAIHAAVIACAGKDCYTGEDLAWEKISTYDNDASQNGRRDYKKSLWALPTVDLADNGCQNSC